jgi:hypothetical protein
MQGFSGSLIKASFIVHVVLDPEADGPKKLVIRTSIENALHGHSTRA